MKICQVITRSDTIGGAQKYVVETSKVFIKDGHDVNVISSSGGILSEHLARENIPAYGLRTLTRKVSFLNDLRSILSIRNIVKRDTPDAVMFHSAKSGLLGRIALLGVPCKKVFIAHGWSHIRSSNCLSSYVYKKLEWLLSYMCDFVVCISKSDFSFAISQIGICDKKAKLVYNGVREPISMPKPLVENSIVNILTVTRFQKPKDFDTLLSALYKVKNKSWHLDVLGEGEDKSFYQEEIIRLGLSDKITLKGFKDDLSTDYNNSDVVVLISRSEGLPLSLLEAMSYQKPIIASNVGGISEIIDEGSSGFLIGNKDVNGLAKKIDYICDIDKEQLRAFGDNSYLKYKESFTFDKTMSGLYHLLQF